MRPVYAIGLVLAGVGGLTTTLSYDLTQRSDPALNLSTTSQQALWSITEPADGEIIYGNAPFAGTGDSQELGTLLIYMHNEADASGTYVSELELQEALTVSTEGSTAWAHSTYCGPGAWLACIFPYGSNEGPNDPLSEGSQVDVVSAVSEMLGDTSFFTSVEVSDP
jgi:hypothetical protein